MIYTLGSGPVPEEVHSLRAAVEAALEASDRSLVVDLDRGTALDAAVLAGLIAGLRKLREAGGTVRLHVTRHDLLKTLEATGLDRVFELVSILDPPASAEAPKAPRPSRKRKLAGGMAAMVLAVAAIAANSIGAFAEAVTAPSAPGGDLNPSRIVSRIIERNPSLYSFEARVDVRMHTGIPFLNPALEGKTYFKRPDNYEVVFTKVPSYAHGIDKLYGDIGDPSNWERRFLMTLAGEQTYNGHRTIVLRLVQRVRGMIDHEDVLIEPQTWAVEKVTYYYYNGGTVALEQSYRDEAGFKVLSDQRATIALPHLPRVTGNAHYSNYHFNVAVDDAVFTERQTKDLGTNQAKDGSKDAASKDAGSKDAGSKDAGAKEMGTK